MTYNVVRSDATGNTTGYLMPPGAERGTEWSPPCEGCGQPHHALSSLQRPSDRFAFRRDTLTWPDGSHWTGPWQKVTADGQ
jgi:hypothetical protein